MQTTTSFKPGNAPDLLSGILSVEVRNEDKITEQDRLFCQNQQDMLYKTLDRIDRWYAIFKEEAEQYRTERDFSYDDNGKISMRDLLLAQKREGRLFTQRVQAVRCAERFGRQEPQCQLELRQPHHCLLQQDIQRIGA